MWYAWEAVPELDARIAVDENVRLAGRTKRARVEVDIALVVD
jgi:hypothetical protein